MYVDGVLASHNFIDGRTPLLLIGFLRHLTKERRESYNVYLNIQNSHDLMPDGLDIFIVFTIWSRTFKGDLREKESLGAP